MGLLSELLYEDEKFAGTSAGTTATPAAEIRSASVAAIPVMAARALPATVEGETKIAAIDQPRSTPTVPTTPACPCPTCNSHLAWESIYRDGVLRCDQCEPSPSPAMIGGWWGLVEGGSEINSRFTWVPVVFEGAERREALKTDRYGAGATRGASGGPPATFEATDAAIALLAKFESEDSKDGKDGETSTSTTHQPRWSPPDADGWCWGVDADGATHMRRHRFVEDGVAAMGEGLQWLGEGEAEWLSRMASVDEVWRERAAG